MSNGDCSGKSYRYPCNQYMAWPFGVHRASTKNPLGIEPLAVPFGVQGGPSIGFLGDVMPVRGEKLQDVDLPIRRVLASFDKIVLNLEAPVVEDRVYQGAVDGLKLAFTREGAHRLLDALAVSPDRVYVSLGNNHANDYGREQLEHTVRFLEDRGHPVIGLSDTRLGATTLELGALRFGLVAWTYWLNEPWTHGCEVCRPSLREDVLDVDFGSMKADRGWDFVIAYSHWRYEFKHFPRERFGQVAEQLAAHGVDVNVGHHPHVVSPLARIGERFVHYSIGNFSGLHHDWHTRLGGILTLRAERVGTEIRFGFDMTPVYRDERGGQELVTDLQDLKPSLRRKCEERFRLVFPPAGP